VIQKLHKYIPVHSAVLVMAILRLIHNLAFDSAARAELVASGMVPKLVDIMQEPRHAPSLPSHTSSTQISTLIYPIAAYRLLADTQI